MITTMTEVPGNVAAFRASGIVTKEDFTNTVVPKVNELIEKYDELNYLMVIDTSIGNFSGGAWLQDMLLGIKNITKWKRAAILTDSDSVNWFTDVFSYLVPGEFKGFYPEQLPAAIAWVSGNEIQP